MSNQVGMEVCPQKVNAKCEVAFLVFAFSYYKKKLKKSCFHIHDL